MACKLSDAERLKRKKFKPFVAKIKELSKKIEAFEEKINNISEMGNPTSFIIIAKICDEFKIFLEYELCSGLSDQTLAKKAKSLSNKLLSHLDKNTYLRKKYNGFYSSIKEYTKKMREKQASITVKESKEVKDKLLEELLSFHQSNQVNINNCNIKTLIKDKKNIEKNIETFIVYFSKIFKSLVIGSKNNPQALSLTDLVYNTASAKKYYKGNDDLRLKDLESLKECHNLFNDLRNSLFIPLEKMGDMDSLFKKIRSEENMRINKRYKEVYKTQKIAEVTALEENGNPPKKKKRRTKAEMAIDQAAEELNLKKINSKNK